MARVVIEGAPELHFVLMWPSDLNLIVWNATYHEARVSPLAFALPKNLLLLQIPIPHLDKVKLGEGFFGRIKVLPTQALSCLEVVVEA